MPLDAGFVLTRNFDSLFSPNVAAGLGVDMALLERHVERIVDLGYRPVTGRSSLTWTISRLLLWRGDPDIASITSDDIMAFGEEVSRYCALPEAAFIRASHVSNARRREPLDKLAAQHEKACRTRMFVLHVLLFDIGQVTQEPRHGLAKDVIWKRELTRPARQWRSPRPSTAGFPACCRRPTGPSRSATPASHSATCAEGPCECDLYLRCPKFFTTSEYTPRLQARLTLERQLVQDAVERGWPREAERHTAISGRICELLTQLGEALEPDEGDS